MLARARRTIARLAQTPTSMNRKTRKRTRIALTIQMILEVVSSVERQMPPAAVSRPIVMTRRAKTGMRWRKISSTKKMNNVLLIYRMPEIYIIRAKEGQESSY